MLLFVSKKARSSGLSYFVQLRECLAFCHPLFDVFKGKTERILKELGLPKKSQAIVGTTGISTVFPDGLPNKLSLISPGAAKG
jgi:hypothetical protein